MSRPRRSTFVRGLFLCASIVSWLSGCSSSSPPHLESIAVTPANETIPQNFPVRLEATGTYTDRSTKVVTTAVTWNSTQASVAQISSSGVVTGQSQGSTTIQATLDQVQGSTNLNVSAATLTGLVVSPQNATVTDAGETQQFAAKAKFSDGTALDATSKATWSSSNTQVATVDENGLAKSLSLAGGQAAAFTSIQALVGSIQGVSVLSVTDHTGDGFAGVFTQHNDIGRTGQNLNETILTLSNVNSTTFGKVFAHPVDGNLYAQPLYVSSVSIPGKGNHNVVYVATEGDSVYAFDADNNIGANANPLWQVSLLDAAHGASAGATTLSSTSDVFCPAIDPQYGVTSTPVIDPSTGTMYVEAESKENGAFVHRLHALDISTGLERDQGPVTITGAVPGTGDGSVNGTLAFNPRRHLNRPGLLLVNGSVYVGFGSNCDQKPYHGWIFAYDAGTLRQQTVFVTTPNSSDGPVWMSGAGISADSDANIYVATGNGTFDSPNIPATQFGDSILKLALSGNILSVIDYFSPFNQSTLDVQDLDLGSGGVLLLPDQPGPHPHELVESGKGLRTYVLDRDQMTANNLHICLVDCNNTDPQIVQETSAVGVLYSVPAFWNNTVYFWGAGNVMKSFTLSNGMLQANSHAPASTVIQFPGATPAISADGSVNGIVWAVDSSQNESEIGIATGPAVLYAFDATNLANIIYVSSQAASNRDVAGPANKFVVPTIANGKVYVGTQTELDVYGLLSTTGANFATRVSNPIHGHLGVREKGLRHRGSSVPTGN